MSRKTRLQVAFALLPILLAGCAGTRHPELATVYYVLEYEEPAVAPAEPVAAVVQVERFQVAPVFHTQHMVYRRGAYTRYTDPYHKWRVSPGDLVTDNLTRDLRRTRLFGGVLASGSRFDPTHVLEGTVDQFYEHDAPGGREAVLGVSVVLAAVNPSDVSTIVVFDHVYTIREPLAEPTPKGLADAMSRAMRAFSQKIIADVRDALNADGPHHQAAVTAVKPPGGARRRILMHTDALTGLNVWKRLQAHAGVIDQREHHLRHLIADPNRMASFSAEGPGMYLDFSRQRVDAMAMNLLFQLAQERQVDHRFKAMHDGEKVNGTENRAALHTALRCFSDRRVIVDGADVMPDIRSVREKIRRFSESVRGGHTRGSTGKPFRHVVVVGIGGSYLGTEFVSTALSARADGRVTLHYLSNVDIDNFGAVVSCIDPEATLWVVISKSYTTPETLANTRRVYELLERDGLAPADHVVTVTGKGSPGDDPSSPVLDTFHMYDFIGGRYSVTSAVGGVPLSLFLGYEAFEGLLRGAEAMDTHALTAPACSQPAAHRRPDIGLEQQLSRLSGGGHHPLRIGPGPAGAPCPAVEHGEQRKVGHDGRGRGGLCHGHGDFRRTRDQRPALLFPAGPPGPAVSRGIHRGDPPPVPAVRRPVQGRDQPPGAVGQPRGPGRRTGRGQGKHRTPTGGFPATGLRPQFCCGTCPRKTSGPCFRSTRPKP